MVAPAQWHGEFIADLTAERGALRKAEMVGICWLPTANEARLLGDVSDVIPIPYPTGLWESQHGLINHRGPRRLSRLFSIWLALIHRLWRPGLPGSRRCQRRVHGIDRKRREDCNACSESFLDVCGIGRGQSVLFRKAPLRPDGRVVG